MFEFVKVKIFEIFGRGNPKVGGYFMNKKTDNDLSIDSSINSKCSSKET